MAHWKGKITELTASIHMVLAGEDKDAVKLGKGGKNGSSFSRSALLCSLVSFATAESVTAELWGRCSAELLV